MDDADVDIAAGLSDSSAPTPAENTRLEDLTAARRRMQDARRDAQDAVARARAAAEAERDAARGALNAAERRAEDRAEELADVEAELKAMLEDKLSIDRARDDYDANELEEEYERRLEELAEREFAAQRAAEAARREAEAAAAAAEAARLADEQAAAAAEAAAKEAQAAKEAKEAEARRLKNAKKRDKKRAKDEEARQAEEQFQRDQGAMETYTVDTSTERRMRQNAVVYERMDLTNDRSLPSMREKGRLIEAFAMSIAAAVGVRDALPRTGAALLEQQPQLLASILAAALARPREQRPALAQQQRQACTRLRIDARSLNAFQPDRLFEPLYAALGTEELMQVVFGILQSRPGGGSDEVANFVLDACRGTFDSTVDFDSRAFSWRFDVLGAFSTDTMPHIFFLLVRARHVPLMNVLLQSASFCDPRNVRSGWPRTYEIFAERHQGKTAVEDARAALTHFGLADNPVARSVLERLAELQRAAEEWRASGGRR